MGGHRIFLGQNFKKHEKYIQCFLVSDVKNEADLWLLNSCTVKSPAEDHFRNEIKAGKDTGKHVVVAGCVPQGQTKANYIQVRNDVMRA